MSLDKEKKMQRRSVIGGMAALAATAAADAALAAVPLPRERPKSADVATLPPKLQAFLDAPAAPRDYTMGDLEGSRFGYPLNHYLGVYGAAGKSEKIDFRRQLAVLWRLKLNRKMASGENFQQDELAGIERLLTSYDVDSSPKFSLEKYHEEIAKSLAEGRAAVNLDRVPSVYQFSDFEKADVQLLKHLESKITPTTLLAYALTEIMPTKGADGVIGVKAFSFLLGHGGSDSIDLIPALADNEISLGPYQFTRYALFEKGRTREGASRINAIANKRLIPPSVLELRGNDHHRAAYCFALYNLAYAISDLEEGQSTKLLKAEMLQDLDPFLVAQYISSAHHLPAKARRSFVSYTDQLVRARERPGKKTRFDPYIGHAAAAGVSGYVNKTTSNLVALKKLHGWTP